ncbi:restriction endonuclease [Akkermansiaceae bacterium]|nr:restriction endonuclease [Akkermansiaceae bacterium]
MLHPSIRLEGSILSADILDAIERGERAHQLPKDFGLDPGAKVKDEIADAWAAARAYWAAYQVKIGRLKEGATGTTETRNQWLVRCSGLLGYQLNLAESETLQGKTYRISHRDPARDQLPVHLIGWHESLDRRSTVPNAPRMSPHGLVQEYLNLTEHLYGIVSNGRLIRLLRDSSRLVKLTFIEFDLERIFTEELFADFALFYRLLHASRLPVRQDNVAEAPIEIYHQDSLDSGSRIRDGLSTAVHRVILDLANGLLNHPANDRLRQFAANDPNGSFPGDFYAHLLRLIYRLLFLMVIEERGLAHVPGTDKRLREIYDLGYSLARLRRLSEKPHFAEARHSDAWLALIALFRLVDESGRGLKLGVAPLGGDLFNRGSLGVLEDCSLDNATFLGALRQLTLFTNPVTRQLMRVNYGALNVEEFGSVYQGLLEFEPRVTEIDGKCHFAFAQGDERGATGSHYTEDELVQPLIKHSLDHLIAEKLKQPDPVAALLSLRVADISCGSGHILLAAARRIGLALAIVRTGDDQPSPTAYREAVRDVIKNCIYGVDLNPLAVELCKVALWLEAHVPGEPLGFLDHHIKCGNAIVGFVTRDELDKGIPDEAFKTLPGDDKDIAAAFRKVNKAERKERASGQKQLPLAPELQEKLDSVLARMRELSALPEHTPAEIAAKKKRYATQSQDAYLLRQIAAIPIAQFYQPKTAGNKANLITDASFRHYLAGPHPQGQATASAWALAERKKAFHWFLEFPDIIANGGFDCILGNPPYLGGQALSGTYGHSFCEYVRWQYAPTGLSDLVAFFLRRIFTLIRPNGFTAFITTNSIKDGDVRKDGLEQVVARGGTINMAVRGIRWPGVANLVVSLVSIHRGDWKDTCFLDGKPVEMVNTYFEDSEDTNEPSGLAENANQMFQGSIFSGDGFLLNHSNATAMLANSSRLSEVVLPVINGQELNNNPDQRPGRRIIQFFDWPLDKAERYSEALEHLRQHVKPWRDANARLAAVPWWQFERPRLEVYRGLAGRQRCYLAAATTKYLNFSASPVDRVYLNTTYIFTADRWDHYAVVQSTIHEIWARKYSGALKQDLRYSPSDCFGTFAFPAGQWQHHNPDLAAIGERYHEHRRDLMLRLWLGLTDIYNLFHAPDLDARLDKLFQKRAKTGDWQSAANVPPEHRATAGSLTPPQAHDAILHLRDLHRQLDQAVLTAYAWHQPGPDGPAIHLAHDFQQVETLPENDRTRYTITPQARKDLLTRLLKLNHQRAAEEKEQATTKRKTVAAKQQVIQLPTDDLDLFRPAASKPARLAFPKSERQSLTGEPFLLVLVHYFMNLAGEEATVRNLDGVFHLLRNRTTHRDNIIAAIGTIGEAWFKGYNDEPPNKLFIPFLKKLEEQRWIEVDRETGQLRRLSAFKQPTQPHPWQELDVNIALQVLKSEPEVIDIITETSKSTRVSSAFGITQSA